MSTPANAEGLALGVLRASEFAAAKHAAQVRKGSGRPYIEHPLAVARQLAEFARCTDVAVLQAALLVRCARRECLAVAVYF